MVRPLSLTWSQVLAWRARRSHLTTPSTTGVVDVARRLSGVQAQVMSSAELALSIRTKNVQPADVNGALWRERSLVKTWTARGTLHLVPPNDLPLWLAAMQARGRYWAKPAWERYHGVSASEMDLVLDGIDEVLDGRALTRAELAQRLGRVIKRPDVAERVMGSWGSVIKPAAYWGKLCFGPNRGRNVTFVSPREWIGPWDDVDGDEALGELALRYVDTYGPSTRDDYIRWLGVESKVGRRGFDAIASTLVPVDVEGVDAWLTPAGAADIARRTSRSSVRLLPAFDPYVVGVLKHLERLLPDPSLRARVSRAAGWISPTIVINGRVVGVWRPERGRRRVDIAIDPFFDLASADEKALRVQMEAMSRLLERVPADDNADANDS
jgi:hypothetical protein